MPVSVEFEQRLGLELFRCPACRCSLHWSEETGSAAHEVCCGQCNRRFPACGDSVDFVDPNDRETEERAHYQTQYESSEGELDREILDTQEWFRLWHHPHWPERQIILRRLGDLSEKLVLCLGNGASVKELYFLRLGARLILTDLSLNGVKEAQSRYDLSDCEDRVAFHAMSAYEIPLRDGSVDVVYGFEFVHHLPEIPPFFEEVRRVLKPGGLCVLFDHGYSPIWQNLKLSILRPLMKLTHYLRGISPEDLRYTYAGGYREADLTELIRRHGFTNEFFERTTFLQYLCKESVAKLLGYHGPRWCYWIPTEFGRLLDRFLTKRIGLLKRSRIEMVWGFEKP